VGFLSSLFGGSKGKGKGASYKKGKTGVNVSKRFDLRGKTGQGSMSKVFQAYDRELGRTVALKLLDKEKTKKFEERFKSLSVKKPTEGQVCIDLTHPNIVKTFEFGTTTQNEPYLVMEWVEGNGLNFLVETRNAQLNGNRISFICQMCDAIEYLHGQKYIHRDLCSRNVMVTPDGQVKLIDFGLTVPNLPEFLVPGNRTGTTDYMAPEIIKRQTTDLRVDVFALGVTAYEIFTGQMPWERTPSSDENLRRRLNTPPRDAKTLRPDLDDQLIEVLMKGVERERGARYQTAAAMKKAFQGLSKQDY
jgi:eukaryotic-like serine/threonine-protein kinase